MTRKVIIEIDGDMMKISAESCSTYEVLGILRNAEKIYWVKMNHKDEVNTHEEKNELLSNNDHFLNSKITDFACLHPNTITNKLLNVFEDNNIVTFRDLHELGQRGLTRYRNVGFKSIEIIKTIFNNNGIKFKKY